eukprot:6739505-Pyramimonas_sp.AAC.1
MPPLLRHGLRDRRCRSPLPWARGASMPPPLLPDTAATRLLAGRWAVACLSLHLLEVLMLGLTVGHMGFAIRITARPTAVPAPALVEASAAPPAPIPAL